MAIICSHLATFFITGTILFGLSEAQTVCYNLVGGNEVTFFSNYPPFDNANGNLPKSPRQVGTNFVLFLPGEATNRSIQMVWPYHDIYRKVRQKFSFTVTVATLVDGS